ncbi:hypothetical protein [Curtobacterium herbarum]|uniref:hypothetical protein n=1 Tax=Curtobacterium herbarum TaxID=150122 RepID=UPI00195702A5|nr:hypothetical protein [Curtobacterium herbarum]MBM7474894.1 hypothetical protein [Curtobacterium herbarum]MCS6545541.1 hypothetical protein [Curtobacterium herbarum]
MDAHKGEVYRYGEDEEIDGLYEQRWSLYTEHISATDGDSYYTELREVEEWVSTEREAARFPTVERRLTTHERRARGLRDSRPV